MTRSPIVRFNVAATALFSAVAVATTIVFNDVMRVVVVVVSLALFAVGVASFLLGFFAAVQRSRNDEIAVSQLFFLSGSTAPQTVKRTMLGALAVQAAVGVGCAVARPSTDGKSGSVLAFGVLVPMLGLGLNGLWSSRHGVFSPRSHPETGETTTDEPTE